MTPSANLKIGFARLSDSASVIVSRARGEFEKQGLNVDLVRFDSWAAMRDSLAHGAIDAAHILAPIVVASAAGLGPYPGRFKTSFSINLNGNAITISNALIELIKAQAPETLLRRPFMPTALKSIVEQRRRSGAEPLTFGHVYHYSMHGLELRYWLAAAGLDPLTDIKLVAIPPERMVESLASGVIDGFCVGEPWNSVAQDAGIGQTVVTSSEIWSNSPEKVLAVRKDWSDDNPMLHLALLKAMLLTSRWLDVSENRMESAKIMAQPDYLDLPNYLLLRSLTGKGVITSGNLVGDMPDFNVFHRYAANFPWRSHAAWILTQMQRWSEAPLDLDIQSAANAAYDTDLYREAAKAVNAPYPTIDRKTEGLHSHAWLLAESSSPIAMGPDRFIDERIFDASEGTTAQASPETQLV